MGTCGEAETSAGQENQVIIQHIYTHYMYVRFLRELG